MSTQSAEKVARDPLMVRNARIQSRGHKCIIEILIFILIFMIATCVEGFLIMLPTMIGLFQTPAYQEVMDSASQGMFSFELYMDKLPLMMEQMPEWVTIATLFGTAGIIITALFYCAKIEKRKLSTVGLTRKKSVSEYLIGLGIGLLMFVLVIGLNFLFGSAEFVGLTFQPGMIPILLITLIGYGVQGASEEILCRGYFCVSAARYMPLWVGVMLNSVAFACLHLSNPGISPLAMVNLFLFGVFMSVYMIRRGNLWGACAIHSIWNFAQGNIFGLRVSGMNVQSSVLSIQQTEAGSLWNGGSFGPEGGLCVTFVLVAGILILWLFCKNKNLGQTAEPLPEILQQAPEKETAAV